MAGKEGKPAGAADREGGIATAKEAARRGASERATEAEGVDIGAGCGGAERPEPPGGADGDARGGADHADGGRSGRDG